MDTTLAKELALIANSLDSKGLVKEADIIDSIISKLAGPEWQDLVPGTRYHHAPGNLIAPSKPQVRYVKQNPYSISLRDASDFVTNLKKRLTEDVERAVERVSGLSPVLNQEDVEQGLAVRFINNSIDKVVATNLPTGHKLDLLRWIMAESTKIHEAPARAMSEKDLLKNI